MILEWEVKFALILPSRNSFLKRFIFTISENKCGQYTQTLNLFGFSQKKVFYDGTDLKSCVGFGLSALLTTFQEFRAWKPVPFHSINKKWPTEIIFSAFGNTLESALRRDLPKTYSWRRSMWQCCGGHFGAASCNDANPHPNSMRSLSENQCKRAFNFEWF